MVKELFLEMDDSGDGVLDQPEILALSIQLGHRLNARELKEAMTAMDEDVSRAKTTLFSTFLGHFYTYGWHHSPSRISTRFPGAYFADMLLVERRAPARLISGSFTSGGAGRIRRTRCR